jgi:thiol-disulfide isomerase/thioredoxin
MIFLTDDSYTDAVYAGRTKPFVLFFSSDTCPHCQTVEAVMKRLESDPAKPCEFDIYCVKPSPETARIFKKFQITAFPTVLFFKQPEKGAEEAVVGAADAHLFATAVEKICRPGLKKRIFSFFGRH